MSIELENAIETLENSLTDPHHGLPESIFLFVSRITPLVNVDLLVKNEAGETLLTWRDDGYSPPGWHVPGGIIRFKETAVDRIKAVGRSELGAEVSHASSPLSIMEIIHPHRKERGHFISFLYRCSLITPPADSLRFQGGSPRPGQWKWHARCPNDILDVHEIYRQFIDDGGKSGEV